MNNQPSRVDSNNGYILAKQSHSDDCTISPNVIKIHMNKTLVINLVIINECFILSIGSSLPRSVDFLAMQARFQRDKLKPKRWW